MPVESQEPNIKAIDFINGFFASTDRLNIAKFSYEHVNDNLDHELNTEIMRYIRDPKPEAELLQQSLEVAAPWDGEEGRWALLAVSTKETDEYLGILSFRYESIENNTIELGWRLHSDHHGNGYATEAASHFIDKIIKHLQPHKMVAYCVAENTASSKLMKKLGMQHEGRLRQFSRLGEKWCDEDVYGLICS